MDHPLTSMESLHNHEVHVWLLKDNGEVISPDYLSYLDTEEHERYHKMIAPGKQRQFLLGRIFLKRLLGEYLGRDINDVRLPVDKNRKPYLADNELFFNLSHTFGAFGVIVAHHRVGIDVEYTRRQILRNHYDHIFTPEEISELKEKADAEKAARFFRLWTLKEAVWKSMADASEIPFNGFGFRFDPVRIYSHTCPLPESEWQFSVREWGQEHMLATAIENTAGVNMMEKQFELNTRQLISGE